MYNVSLTISIACLQEERGQQLVLTGFPLFHEALCLAIFET